MINQFTVDTSKISWWDSNKSAPSSWTFSSTYFSGSSVPKYAEKQCVTKDNVQLYVIDITNRLQNVYTYTAYDLTQLNYDITTYLPTYYPNTKSGNTLRSKIYNLPAGTSTNQVNPYTLVTNHTVASTAQSFDPTETYKFLQYTIDDSQVFELGYDPGFVSGYNGCYPPDFHYVKIYGNADDMRVRLYGKWHLTGDTLPTSYQNTQVVGYNQTVTTSARTISSDCTTNDNVMTIDLTIGKNGTRLQQTGTFTYSSVEYTSLNIYSYFIQQYSGTKDVSISIPVASSYICGSVARHYLKIYAENNGIAPIAWDGSPVTV